MQESVQAGGGFAKVTTGRGWLPNDKMQLFFLSFFQSFITQDRQTFSFANICLVDGDDNNHSER